MDVSAPKALLIATGTTSQNAEKPDQVLLIPLRGKLCTDIVASQMYSKQCCIQNLSG